MNRYEGKVCVVTGAASGIGRATARRLAEEGGRVACLDVHADGAEVVAKELDGAIALACDVGDEAAVAATIKSVRDELGPVNVLCNIAGVGGTAHAHEHTLAEWDRMIRVNLIGTFLLSREVIPEMLEAGQGVIVNTASTAGVFGQAYTAAYSATKGGVVMLTKSMAYEYAGRGIRINAVAPGFVDTEIINSFSNFPEGHDRKKIYRSISPAGMSSPEEIAGLFAYIASDEARFMTGSIVLMDGGMIC